jgi:hypothetical protein
MKGSPNTAERDALSERLISSDGEHVFDEDPMSQIVSGGEIVVEPPLQAVHGQRGQSQVPEFRDAAFAVGFLSHMILVLFLAVFWGLGSLRQGNIEEGDDISTPLDTSYVRGTGLLGLAFFSSLFSAGLSAASLEFMTRYGENLIQMSIFSSCGVMGLVVLVMFSKGVSVLAWLWLFTLMLTVVYAYSVWHRIPFAASNLRTAIAAIQSNYGVCLLGYVIAFCGNLWVLIWSLALLGVNYKEPTCVDGQCEGNIDFLSFLLLLLSYFWVSQVLKVSSKIAEVRTHVESCWLIRLRARTSCT